MMDCLGGRSGGQATRRCAVSQVACLPGRGFGGAGEAYVIFGVDHFGPALSGDFAINVVKGGVVALTPDDLAGNDVVSGAAALTFTVTDPVNGFVALTAAPTGAITSFTQAQLAAGQVRFVHDGSETTRGGFTVALTDAAGNAAEARGVQATVTPTDDNLSAVNDLNAAGNTVAENATTGTQVGLTAMALDPDTGDTVSYTLTDTAGGRFAIDSTTGVVTVAGALDFETSASHQITVRATSSGGDSQTATFTIAVTEPSRVIDSSTLSAAEGFEINGIDGGDLSGRSVASAGDVNGDGIDDVTIGAYLDAPGKRKLRAGARVGVPNWRAPRKSAPPAQ